MCGLQQAKVAAASVPKEFADAQTAFVKATNLDDLPPKEKHVRFLLALCSDGGKPKDVVFVLEATARQIRKSTHWRTMLKTHVVLHRLLMESGVELKREFFRFLEFLSRKTYGPKEQMLFNIRYWKDESTPDAQELAGWTRTYAAYLEEVCALHAHVPQLFTAPGRNQENALRNCDIDRLLTVMPLLQTLARRITECEPKSAVVRKNAVTKFTLSLILRDSFKVYHVMNEAIINLVDKYFDSSKVQAAKGLAIFKKYLTQIDDLQRFYKTCEEAGAFDQSGPMDFKLEAPPPTFLQSMEEYYQSAPNEGVPLRERRMLGPSASTSVRTAPALNVAIPRNDLLSIQAANPSPSSVTDALSQLDFSSAPKSLPSSAPHADPFNSNALPAPQTTDHLALPSTQPATASNQLDFFSMPAPTHATSAPTPSPPQQQFVPPQQQFAPPQQQFAPQQQQFAPQQQQFAPQQQQQQQPSPRSTNPFGDNPFGQPMARNLSKEALADLYSQAPPSPTGARGMAAMAPAHYAQAPYSSALTPTRVVGQAPPMGMQMPGMHYSQQPQGYGNVHQLPMPGTYQQQQQHQFANQVPYALPSTNPYAPQYGQPSPKRTEPSNATNSLI